MSDGFSNTQLTAGAILLILAFLSLTSTMTTLYLMYDMKRRNGYLLLIFNLTVCQIFYDAPFFLVPFYSVGDVLTTANFLFTFAGLAVALWTNVVSFVLYNIVKYLQSFDIYGHYRSFACLVFIPSLVMACCAAVYSGDQEKLLIVNNFYYWVRIGSIVFNVVVHGLISLKLNRMGYAIGGAAAEDPVRVLASRIKYYPIVQIVTRIGAAWYEYAYGFETDSFSEHMSATQQVALYFYAACVPSAGIGYFLVFLAVQPAAYDHLCDKWSSALRRLRDLCGLAALEVTNPSEMGEPSTYSESAATSRVSQRLLGVRELDEDELSQQIDERFLSRSGEVARTVEGLSFASRKSDGSTLRRSESSADL